jgi:hypothetical protein
LSRPARLNDALRALKLSDCRAHRKRTPLAWRMSSSDRCGMFGKHGGKRFSLQEHLAQPAPVRPWWQRIVFPLLGLALIVVGIVGAILPVIPGAPLAPLGFPFLCCFNRRAENWARRLCLRGLLFCKHLVHRFKAWRRLRSDRRRDAR